MFPAAGIDMARQCPNGQCVIAQTEHFLSVLKNANADKAANRTTPKPEMTPFCVPSQ